MEKDPIVVWAIKHPINSRKTQPCNPLIRGQPQCQSDPVFGVPSRLAVPESVDYGVVFNIPAFNKIFNAFLSRLSLDLFS
jgi:hypothetical protein